LIVYKLTSPSNKIYIGITKQSIKKRLNDHVSESKRKTRKINNAFKKYPLKDWVVEIIFEHENFEIIKQKEIELIAFYDSVKSGYNSSIGGEGGNGCIRSEETKRKLSESKKGKKFSAEVYKNMAEKRKGFKQPQSQKDKVTAAKSKTWIVTHPNNTEEVVFNLNKFCREHNLSNGNMMNVVSGRQTQHKGYKVRRPD
jgi:group I intron endonuclease